MADTRTAAQGGRMRPQTFGDAFREARLAGDKTFEFKGKTYTTKTAEEQSREIAAKAAAGSGRGPSAGRTAADRDVTVGRAEIPTGPSKAPAERGERMSPLEMGLLTTAGALAGPAAGRGAMAAYRGAKSTADAVRGAVQASRGFEEARRARVAREMDRELPALAPKERVRVEGTKGGVYRGAKDEKAAEAKPEFRKGGKVKTYASGGSVKGSGCERRGLRKCKVY